MLKHATSWGKCWKHRSEKRNKEETKNSRNVNESKTQVTCSKIHLKWTGNMSSRKRRKHRWWTDSFKRISKWKWWTRCIKSNLNLLSQGSNSSILGHPCHLRATWSNNTLLWTHQSRGWIREVLSMLITDLRIGRLKFSRRSDSKVTSIMSRVGDKVLRPVLGAMVVQESSQPPWATAKVQMQWAALSSKTVSISSTTIEL